MVLLFSKAPLWLVNYKKYFLKIMYFLKINVNITFFGQLNTFKVIYVFGRFKFKYIFMIHFYDVLIEIAGRKQFNFLIAVQARSFFH